MLVQYALLNCFTSILHIRITSETALYKGLWPHANSVSLNALCGPTANVLTFISIHLNFQVDENEFEDT